jgi:flagellar biosynthetic protein FlhB
MTFPDEDRQHPATPNRLKRAREEGDVAHSQELAFAIQMVAGLGALWFCVSSIGNGLRQVTRELWNNGSLYASPATIVNSSQSLVWVTIKLMVPFLVSVFVIGTLAHMVQTRFLVKRPELSLSRMSPSRWFGSIFSLKGFSHLVISTPQILIALAAGGGTLWIYRGSLFALGGMPTNLFATSLLQISAISGMSVAVSLLACSVIDYGLQWRSFQLRTRMTDQELREEIRGQTGDPQIARIRHQRMREITRERR